MTASLRFGRLFFLDPSGQYYSFHSAKMIQTGQTSCLSFLTSLIKRKVTLGNSEQRQPSSLWHVLGGDTGMGMARRPVWPVRALSVVLAACTYYSSPWISVSFFWDHTKNNCTVTDDLVAN